MYDYLVVDTGLYGTVFAHDAKEHGNNQTSLETCIQGIWKAATYINMEPTSSIQTTEQSGGNQFSEFNRFTNFPVANYHGEFYSLLSDMYTFNKMWGVTPEEAAAKIEEQKQAAGITDLKNIEAQTIVAKDH